MGKLVLILTSRAGVVYLSPMLTLYNSMSRSKEPFRPREDRHVKIFTCGPSTYRRPHLGNYRTFLYEDVLVRYLEYRGFEVRRVINFTDVEDKMLEEAVLEGRRPEVIAAEVGRHFFRETAQLQIKLPRKIARASESVPQAVELIRRLLDRGVAYWHRGNVFFDPLKVKDFGKLYRLDMSAWPKRKVRFKKDTYNGLRWNRGDFILWHGHNNGDLSAWDTQIGKGRPSWNIQDPAMITEHLGEQVDINCGGIDNIYRHHDYNIAIMEALTGKRYANYYLHGAHLIVDGKPMSKSRGNIVYLEDLEAKGFQPYHLRFFLIYTHYRRRLNLTEARLRQAAWQLDSLRALAAELSAGGGRGAVAPRLERLLDRLAGEFERHMDDDLSVGMAVDSLSALLRDMRESFYPLPPAAAKRLKAELIRIDGVLQVLL
jgi:cysteinyl-tRNA synthetase